MVDLDKIRKVDKLPKNPKKGEKFLRITNSKNGKRKITFQATGKKGFGKWKIISNKKA
jgi:hypothetical protein